jgi:tRNA pseudouridine(55) synthase
MNGIINVLKPPGMTSHGVVSYIRKVLNMKKVGHTGTLDPEAAGVLPVCLGKATKAVRYITDKKKSYRANIRFGTVTDTYDSYGQIIKEDKSVVVDRETLENTIKNFIGTIRQKPPMYSAVKIKGKKSIPCFGSAEAHAVTSTAVSPYLTRTAASANWANLPVSIISVLPASSSSNTSISFPPFKSVYNMLRTLHFILNSNSVKHFYLIQAS